MDLTNLRDSLDSSSRDRHAATANAKRRELRLTRDFKAAALQLTTLYRTSLSSASQSYSTGYAKALSDILDVVQVRSQQQQQNNIQSSLPGRSTAVSDELSWLAAYLIARKEAISSEIEEEDKLDSEEEATAADETEVGAAPPSGPRDGNARRSNAFTFSAPKTPTNATSAGGSSSRPRRSRSGVSPRVASTQAASVPSTPTVSSSVTQNRATSPSSDEDMQHTDGISATTVATPSRRLLSTRLGKRLTGRDKLSAHERIERTQSSKRHRGMGDRDEGLS